MQSIRKDSVEIILNDELWELFTLQAEIEAMRRCGRHYALTVDEMRKELIFDAAREQVRAQTKLDQMRRCPVDISQLDQLAKLCFVASHLDTPIEKVTAIATDKLESKEGFPKEILELIESQGDLATYALAQVFSERLMESCSDWIKASVLGDSERQSRFQNAVAGVCGLEPQHAGVVATAQALLLLARDYQSDFEFYSSAATQDGMEIRCLEPVISRAPVELLASA